MSQVGAGIVTGRVHTYHIGNSPYRMGIGWAWTWVWAGYPSFFSGYGDAPGRFPEFAPGGCTEACLSCLNFLAALEITSKCVRSLLQVNIFN
jgi:hypothetical protein